MLLSGPSAVDKPPGVRYSSEVSHFQRFVGDGFASRR